MIVAAVSAGQILRGVPMVLAAIVALGVVIIIHEIGHFISAKKTGVKVETFSIGFGPKLFGIKRGETEYRVSLIFIAGGYVKMKGMEPEEGKPPQEIEGGFYAAKPGRRALIAFAAPFMNVVLALAVFTLLWFTGTKVPQWVLTTTIGFIEEDSPARAAGLVPGDTVLEVNGGTVHQWKDIIGAVAFSGFNPVSLTVERDGTIVKKDITVEWDKEVGFRRLQIYPRVDIIISEVEKGSLAEKLGLRKDDRLVSLARERLYHLDQFREILGENVGKTVEIMLRRDDQKPAERTVSFTVPPPKNEIGVTFVKKGSSAEKVGLKTGDLIATVSGQKATTIAGLREVLRSHAGQEIQMEVRRQKKPPPSRRPPQVSGEVILGAHLEEAVPVLGFMPGIVYEVKKEDPFSATHSAIRDALLTLKALVTRRVSTKGISGPVGIVGMIAKSISVSFTTFLYFIGFLSANFAVINLLPIPIVDGGHIMFCAIEKVRRKPIRQKTMTIIVNTFFILILAFFVFVTKNDIVRFFKGEPKEGERMKKVVLTFKVPEEGVGPPGSEVNKAPSEP
jgi:regulator of sigma E protease